MGLFKKLAAAGSLLALIFLFLVCGEQQEKSQNPTSTGQNTRSIPQKGTAISPKQGNLNIQFSYVPGLPSKLSHKAYCQDKRYLVDVPRGRRVLDGKSITKLCENLIEYRDQLSGDQRCPDLKKRFPQIKIYGRLDGSDFTGQYSMGPCREGMQSWEKIVSAWQTPTKKQPVKSSWQQVILLKPSAGQPKPKFFMQPYSDPEWKTTYRGSPPPCVVSMKLNPYAVCVLKLKGEAGIPVYIRLPAEQIQQLIGASPDRILNLIRQAAIVPPPPGWPGYTNSTPRGPAAIPQNSGSLSK